MALPWDQPLVPGPDVPRPIEPVAVLTHRHPRCGGVAMHASASWLDEWRSGVIEQVRCSACGRPVMPDDVDAGEPKTPRYRAPKGRVG